MKRFGSGFSVYLILCCLSLVPALAADGSKAEIKAKYGKSFAAELKKRGWTLQDVEKRSILFVDASSLATLPLSHERDLHEKNHAALHRFVLADIDGKNQLVMDKYFSTDARALSFVMLSRGGAVKAAGLLGVAAAKPQPKFLITNRSKKYCTDFSRLTLVRDVIVAAGFSADQIVLRRDRPLSCESLKTRQERMVERFSNEYDEENAP